MAVDETQVRSYTNASIGYCAGALCIGRLPGRKTWALYETNGDVHVLAWFKSKDAALACASWIDAFVHDGGPLPSTKPAVSP